MTQTDALDWREWNDRVLQPILENRPDDVPLHADVAILSADTDRTQEYVFESTRLPEIRGASMLLDELNRSRTPMVLETHFHLPADCIIYAGGGSLLAIVPGTIAEEIAGEIEKMYPHETYTATVSTAIYHPRTTQEFWHGFHLNDFTLERLQALRRAGLHPAEMAPIVRHYDDPVHPDGQVDARDWRAKKHFGELVALLGQRLRAKKEQKRQVPFYETMPYAVRCESCGVRPASVAQTTPENGERQLCVVCAHKQRDRRFVKNMWVERFKTKCLDQNSALAQSYSAGFTLPVSVAQDISEIAAASTRPGFVGFIYADGNSIGKFIERQTTPSMYRDASEAIAKAMEMAVYQSLAENLCAVKNADGTLIHPFEIITIGGDDVLLLVPGHAALPIAARICQLFQQAMPDLAMSAGVVLADESNPVRFLRDLARQLMKNAKEKCHRESSLDWLVLTSQSTLQTNLDGLRDTPPYKLATERSDQFLWLTSRPWTLKDTRTILRILKNLRAANFPTSQLHAMAAILPKGQHRASLFYIYQLARMNPDQRQIFQGQTEKDWGLDPQTDPAPWQMVREGDQCVGYRTLLRDLVELYDFVPQTQDWASLWQPLLKEG